MRSAKPFFAVYACLYCFVLWICLYYFVFNIILSKIVLVNSGDIKTNPGRTKSSPIKFCHWKLNGLAARDIIKVPLIQAFTSAHNFDILCLSENFQLKRFNNRY